MSEARYMEEQYSEKIEALEEDLEFLKAEAILVERKVEMLEEALQDARRSYEYWHDRVLTED